MGRNAHSKTLEIWTNAEHAGTWNIPTRGGMELRYDEDWLKSPAGRPLSLSLPFGVGGSSIKTAAVENFFRNLLPDSDAIRKRLAEKFRLKSAGTWPPS